MQVNPRNAEVMGKKLVGNSCCIPGVKAELSPSLWEMNMLSSFLGERCLGTTESSSYVPQAPGSCWLHSRRLQITDWTSQLHGAGVASAVWARWRTALEFSSSVTGLEVFSFSIWIKTRTFEDICNNKVMLKKYTLSRHKFYFTVWNIVQYALVIIMLLGEFLILRNRSSWNWQNGDLDSHMLQKYFTNKKNKPIPLSASQEKCCRHG